MKIVADLQQFKRDCGDLSLAVDFVEPLHQIPDCLVDLSPDGKSTCVETFTTMRAGDLVVSVQFCEAIRELLSAFRAGEIRRKLTA